MDLVTKNFDKGLYLWIETIFKAQRCTELQLFSCLYENYYSNLFLMLHIITYLIQVACQIFFKSCGIDILNWFSGFDQTKSAS